MKLRLLVMVATIAFALIVGGQNVALARGGGFHGGGFHGGFHGGGFHGGYHGGGFHGGGFHGGYHGGGYHGGGFHGGGFAHGRFRGPHYFGGYGYGYGLGSLSPWWGLGVFLPGLPLGYLTYWWDGMPFYYVDNDYYVWDGDTSQYEQVQPPTQVTEEASGEIPEAMPRLFAYPEHGQSAKQQATDREQCSSWASGQSHFYPGASGSVATAPPASSSSDTGQGATDGQGTTSANASSNAAATAAREQNYLRAETACLEGRGYSVD